MIQIAAEYAGIKFQVIESDVSTPKLVVGPGKSLTSTPAALAYLAAKHSKVIIRFVLACIIPAFSFFIVKFQYFNRNNQNHFVDTAAI